MAVARVNITAKSDWSGSGALTYAANALSITTGNLIVVAVGGLSNTGQTVTGLADTAGNTYSKVDHVVEAGDTYRTEIWYAKNAIGNAANVVTVTWSASTPYRGIVVAQYAGLDTAAPFDVSAKGTSTSGAIVTTSSYTTTDDNDIHVLVGRWGPAGGIPPAPPGFTQLSADTNAFFYEAYVAEVFTGTRSLTYLASTSARTILVATFRSTDPPPPANARVTQAVVELVTRPAPPVRVTQGVVELLSTVLGVVVTGIHVSQAPVELLQQVPVSTRVSQAVLEVLSRPPDPGRRLTINGIDRTRYVDAQSVTWVMNERARATIVLGDLLPNKFDDVVIYARDGGHKLFGGVILTRNFAGRNQYDPTFTVSLECGDYFTYTDWTMATLTYATAVTLKAVLTDLITNNLGAYGIWLDPAQVTGPTIDPFVWSTKRVSDAIRELSDRTGYVAEISPEKVLRMFLPGTDAAPAAMTEAAPHCQEVAWTDSDRTVANKVTIIAGPTGTREIIEEPHYGDGTTRIFPLYSPFVQMIGALFRFPENVSYDVGIYGEDDLPYTYDWATNAIFQRTDQPIILVGEGFLINYRGSFPFQVSASTGATPVIEVVETRPDVLSIPAAQEIANGLLAQLTSGGRELAIRTDEDGFFVGQALTVTLPVTRQVSGTFTITEVSLSIVLDVSPTDNYWVYTLKAIESVTYQGSYLDDWRRLTAARPTPSTE